MRVLVCGSRTFNDPALVSSVLTGLYAEAACGYLVTPGRPFVVIEGGARGADDAAAWWAASSPMHHHPLTAGTQQGAMPVQHMQFPADWNTHGRAAGPIRNKQMLVEGQPDVCLAFVDKPLAESRGTANMVNLCRKAGVKTVVVEYQVPRAIVSRPLGDDAA